MSRKAVIAIVGWIVTAAIIAALLAGAWWLWLRLRTGPAVDWNAPGISAALVGSVAGILLAIWWLWWRLPKRQVRGLDIQIHDPKARADTEDNFRKTVGQALGGAAVLIGAGLAYLQFTQQQRASHDLLISQQVSKGFEYLGDRETLMTRLGGIYALEGVMNDSQQYHQPILEALCAFVRTRTSPATNDDIATDVQAALTVIGRRGPGKGDVDLTDAHIVKANLIGANLSGAILSGADLHDAYLMGAQLRRAKLLGAHLSANLTGSDLSGADLTLADLSFAFLNNTNLSGADLTHASLKDANLTNANLSGASLDGQIQLDQACGAGATLPPGLTLKPCQVHVMPWLIPEEPNPGPVPILPPPPIPRRVPGTH